MTSLARFGAQMMLAPANLAVQSMLIGARTMEAAVTTVSDVIGGEIRSSSTPADPIECSMTQPYEPETVELVPRANGDESSVERDWLVRASDAASILMDRLADRSADIAVRFFKTAASTDLGRRTLNGVLVSTDAEHFDLDRERESLIEVTSRLGAGLIYRGFTMAEIAIHLSLFDTRRLAQVIDESIQNLNLVATPGEMHELMPVPLIDRSLQEQAAAVLDQAPSSISRTSRESREVAIAAVFKDAEQLTIFLGGLSRILAILGTNVSKLVADGTLGFSEIEAFLEGRGNQAIPVTKPWSVASSTQH